MGAFAFRLEREDGTPADPPTFRTAVSARHPGDTIPLGPDRTLRVIETRPGTIRARYGHRCPARCRIASGACLADLKDGMFREV